MIKDIVDFLINNLLLVILFALFAGMAIGLIVGFDIHFFWGGHT